MFKTLSILKFIRNSSFVIKNSCFRAGERQRAGLFFWTQTLSSSSLVILYFKLFTPRLLPKFLHFDTIVSHGIHTKRSTSSASVCTTNSLHSTSCCSAIAAAWIEFRRSLWRRQLQCNISQATRQRTISFPSQHRSSYSVCTYSNTGHLILNTKTTIKWSI